MRPEFGPDRRPIGGRDKSMQGTTFYVEGTTALPKDTINTRLIQLYSGGGYPQLMTGIAGVETGGNWRQFGIKCSSIGPFTLFVKSGQWPTESCGVGYYVGLMQIPASMTDGY